MAQKIICKSCGATYEDSLVHCPYCGTAYAPAEEEEYMDKLEAIREDLQQQMDMGDLRPDGGMGAAGNGTGDIGPGSGMDAAGSVPYSAQHAQNMQQFEQSYAATEKAVSRFAKAVEGLGKKAAILVVLLIGIIVMSVVASMNYADPDEDKAVRRDAEKNAAAYAEEADGYLQRGEYVEYVSFLYAHELMNFPPEEFQRFRSVQYVAKEYYECIQLMEEMILRSDDPDYFDGLDTDIRNFCMYVDSFYEVLEAQKSSEKSEEYMAYILDIDDELHAAMRTYFSMDEEELQEFLGMSRAQKAVKLNEVLRHE